jgi:hypothetical protein
MSPRPILLALAFAACASIAGAAFPPATAETAATVERALDFRTTYNHYASVDRVDGKTYRIHINDIGLEGWRADRRLPAGTVIAIESFLAETDASGGYVLENGRMIAGASDNDIHVVMKAEAWSPAETGPETRGIVRGVATENGTWRVAAFNPQTGADTPGLSMQECHDCHRDHRAEDFILSRGLLDRFVSSGQPAFISFSCGERDICFGQPANE